MVPAAELAVLAAGPAAVICGRREESAVRGDGVDASGMAAAKAHGAGDMVGTGVTRAGWRRDVQRAGELA